eukprot:2058016-Lingulodinium_polyedra.AAC.1
MRTQQVELRKLKRRRAQAAKRKEVLAVVREQGHAAALSVLVPKTSDQGGRGKGARKKVQRNRKNTMQKKNKAE